MTASRPAVPAKVTPEPQSVLLLLDEASAGRRRWDGGRCHVVTPWQGGHGGDPCVIGWTDSWGSAGGPTLGPVAGGWEWRDTLLSPGGVCLGWNDVKLLKYTC